MSLITTPRKQRSYVYDSFVALDIPENLTKGLGIKKSKVRRWNRKVFASLLSKTHDLGKR